MKLFDKYLVFFIKSPPIILFFVGTFYGVYLLANLDKDTTSISNIAFGIVAVMAGLSLRMASTISDDEKLKDDFLYSGERFLHSTVLLLSASIIKYATISLTALEIFEKYSTIGKVVLFPFSILVGILFFFSVHSAHSGIKIVNTSLWKRMGRKKGWNDF